MNAGSSTHLQAAPMITPCVAYLAGTPTELRAWPAAVTDVVAGL